MWAQIGWWLLVGTLFSQAARGDERPERFAVTRDTWFSSVGDERDANLGGASKLKLKTYQEMSLVDADLTSLRGRTIQRATLHVRSTGEPRLARVTISGIAADWFEGTSASYGPELGASTFRNRRHPDEPWTPLGGDLSSIILGTGGTTAWRSAPASSPDADGWQTIAIDPAVVASRVAGLSHGFLVFDDTGTEWTRDGNSFTVRPMPNRFVSSRDSNRSSAPYLTITPGGADHDPPPAPGDLRADLDPVAAGEVVVSWMTPTDIGPAGTLGFLVDRDDQPVARALIPLARSAPIRNRLHLQGLNLTPGSTARITVRAVDAAGNVGLAAVATVPVSARVPQSLPLIADPTPDPVSTPLIWRGATIAAVDELDKIDPQTGVVVPTPRTDRAYLASNHVWSASRRQIDLVAARGEIIGWQVAAIGDLRPVEASLTWDDPDLTTSIHHLPPVATPRGAMPDPVVPVTGVVSLKNSSIHFEVNVSHDARPGVHSGVLTLRSLDETLRLAVNLLVEDWVMPDRLGFVPELNAYDLPTAERDYYRLAHRHRTSLNRVPYSQRGVVAAGMAPGLVDGKLDWTAWDARFGPLFDGSAFADLPRGRVPVASFYLPIHENWPTSIEPNYNGGYWADEAFTPAYRRAFVDVSRQFADHLDARGWQATVFEGFLNNKRDFKGGGRGWSGGSSPWLLDEPASWQDFAALRFFARAFHEGVAQARRAHPGSLSAKIGFRADISRPEWQRDGLDGLLDINVVGGALRDHLALVQARKQRENQWLFEYGTANAVELANVQPAAWCVDAWTRGADGVIPWQTIGRAESWTQGDELALLYPPNQTVPGATAGPIPSLRLKAFQRGQQDVEYLIAWGELTHQPRWAVAAAVRQALKLNADRQVRGADDAGSLAYPNIHPADLALLRRRIGRALSEAHFRPAPDPGWTPTPRNPAPVRKGDG